MISRRTIKAVEATIVIAAYTPGHPVSAQEVADILGLPISYLESALRELKQHGIVRSHKGPGGGYQLAGKPDNFTLWDVVKIFELPPARAEGDDDKASFLQVLEESLLQHIQAFFSSQTLAQLAVQVQLPARQKTDTGISFKLKDLPTPIIPRGVSSIFQWRAGVPA